MNRRFISQHILFHVHENKSFLAANSHLNKMLDEIDFFFKETYFMANPKFKMPHTMTEYPGDILSMMKIRDHTIL